MIDLAIASRALDGPGHDVAESAADEVVRLVQAGEHREAAKKARKTVAAGATDVRVIAALLLGVFGEQGPAALPAMLEVLTGAIGRRWEALRPAARRDRAVDSALCLLFRSVKASIDFHESARDATWRAWAERVERDLARACLDAAAGFEAAVVERIASPRCLVELAGLKARIDLCLQTMPQREPPPEPGAAPEGGAKAGVSEVAKADVTEVAGAEATRIAKAPAAVRRGIARSEPTEVGSVGPTQVEGVGPTQVEGVGPTQVEGVGPIQVGGVGPTQVEGVGPTQVADTEATQVGGAEPTEVADAEATQVGGAEPTEVADAEATQVEASRVATAGSAPRAATLGEGGPARHAPAARKLEISPALGRFIRKLEAFAALVERGDMARAAIVARDIKAAVDHFDPRVYLPALLAPHFRLLSAHIEAIAPYWDASDSPAWDALEQLYQVDLDAFLEP